MLNFMKIRPVGAELFHAERQTDMTKLTVAFRNITNAPKNISDKCVYYYILLSANGFVPGGSGTTIKEKNTNQQTSHKITYNTQNDKQHTKLQIQEITYTIHIKTQNATQFSSPVLILRVLVGGRHLSLIKVSMNTIGT